MSKQKTLLLCEDNNAAILDALSQEQLTQLLDKEDDIELVQFDASNGKDPMVYLNDLCAKNAYQGVVLAGSGCYLNYFADYVAPGEGKSNWRVVKVNMLERCAALLEDSKAAAQSAFRQIQVAVSRSKNSLPLTFSDRKVEKGVVIFGSSQAADLVKDAVKAQGFPVTMIAWPDDDADGVVESITGTAGAYHLTVDKAGEKQYIEAGALVMAPNPNLIPGTIDKTLADSGKVTPLSEWAKQIDDAKGSKVCIWMDKDDQESRHVSNTVLTAAKAAQAKGLDVTLLFAHMPVYGKNGQGTYDEIREAGGEMIRYKGKPAATLSGDKVEFEFQDMVLPDTTMTFTADRLVLPEKLAPLGVSADLAFILRQPLDAEGYLQPCNVRHTPVNSPRKGVFYAGAAHGDFDMNESVMEAKAISTNIVALLGADVVRVPHELVTVDKDHCASCLTCYRSCQHAAIEIADGYSVEFTDGACWECGLCASVCPRKAITRSSFSEAQLKAAIDTAVAELNGQKPVVAFLCRNSAAQALENACAEGIKMPSDVVWIEVPCAGHLSESEVMSTLSKGARRVEVFGCHHDNCRSIIGAKTSDNRIQAVQSQLAQLDLSQETVRFHSIAANESHRLAHILWEKPDK